nr:AAA family ATPase [Methylobacterium sp. BTF04]
MAEIQRSLRSEFNRIAEAYSSDYEVALAGEISIKKRLDGLVADAGISNQSRVELRSLESSSQTYRSLYESFLQKYTQAVQDQSFPISEARVVSSAKPPLRKAWPKGLVILGLAIVGGTAIGLMLALLRELVRSSVRTPQAVEQVTGLPCIAIVPRVETFKSLRDVLPRFFVAIGLRQHVISKEMLVDAVMHPLSGTAEAMQEVKMLLERPSGRSAGCRVIGMISAISGEGKTMISSNIAHYLALSGRKVLLLDYDLRYPSLTRALAPKAKVGLLETIDTGILQGVTTIQARGAKLQILPTVMEEQVEHTSDVLRSPNNVALLKTLRSSYDFIIVDYPPALDFSDVRGTDELIDEYLMVVGFDRPSKRDLAECISRDRFDTSRVLGVIFNRADPNRHTKQRSRIGRYMPWNSQSMEPYPVNTMDSS